ncbi:MAG TPA: type II secretion system protein [Anaerohalosphaeraceae bacterium]|nr:type II secretion system protein [Anaerohalosphaeraceae bacterium]HPP57185.1 type II secretion system protein [Anaerohalosphaeraceae bacterium]
MKSVDKKIREIRGLESVKSVEKTCSAFSLVELMIVVAILGILAALVIPEIQGQSQRAKEAAAKENLRIFREAIERYALDHNGIPPGYPNNDVTKTPAGLYVLSQLTILNKYLPKIPKNPLNGYSAIYVVGEGATITDGMMVGSAHGWIYQPFTKSIKLNISGIDSEGKPYFDY